MSAVLSRSTLRLTRSTAKTTSMITPTRSRNLIGYNRFLISPAADRDFGPLGTVGLHIKSTASFQLALLTRLRQPPEQQSTPPAGLLPGSLPHAFLSDGDCPAGTKFRVRITDPTNLAVVGLDGTRADGSVELVINETYLIRFASRDPSPTSRYTATCTRAFWPGCDPEDLTELVVTEFDLEEAGSPINIRAASSEAPFDHQEWFCREAITRIRELLAVALCRVYWIGAIRSVERRASVEEQVFEDFSIMCRPYVGGQGEYTQALARLFAYNEMRLAGDNGPGAIDYTFRAASPKVHAMLLAARDSTIPSPARRIWELASEESRQLVSRIANAAEKHASAPVIRLLNEVLRRRDLHDSDVWPVRDPEAHALLHEQIAGFTDDQVMQLN